MIITVIVSIYALSGRLILGNAQSMEEEWAKLDAQVEAQEDRLLAAKPPECLPPIGLASCKVVCVPPNGR